MDIIQQLEEAGFESAMLNELVLDNAMKLADETNESGMMGQVDFLRYTIGMSCSEIMESADKCLSYPGEVVRGVISIGLSESQLNDVREAYDVYQRDDTNEEFFLDTTSFEEAEGLELATRSGLSEGGEHLIGRYILFHLDS